MGDPAGLQCKCGHLVLTASLPETQARPGCELKGRLNPMGWKKGLNPISYSFLVSSQKIKCELTENIPTLAEWQLEGHLEWH